MTRQRYRLHAEPRIPTTTAATTPTLSQNLADEFNAYPEYFFFRRSARRAANFYTRVLTLPLIFTVEEHHQ